MLLSLWGRVCPGSQRRTSKTLLPPGFVEHQSDGIRQVQAAATRLHGDIQPVRFRQGIQKLPGEAARLRTKYQCVARLEFDIRINPLTPRRQRVGPCRPNGIQESIQVRIIPNLGKFMVIESCPPQAGVIEAESQWMDEVQTSARIGAEPDDVTGVRWYLRLAEDDMEHPQAVLALTGSSFQMSRLYSSIVRSEENLPAAAVLRMLIRVQCSSSWNATAARFWAST
jgi:hypothetical protein